MTTNPASLPVYSNTAMMDPVPGAATMACNAILAACRACYDVAGFLFRVDVTRSVRRAWERGDAWEVAVWCAWLQRDLETASQGERQVAARRVELQMVLDRALAGLCCTEGIAPVDVWRALDRMAA